MRNQGKTTPVARVLQYLHITNSPVVLSSQRIVVEDLVQWIGDLALCEVVLFTKQGNLVRQKHANRRSGFKYRTFGLALLGFPLSL